MTEPAWLTHLVDQRLALLDDKVLSKFTSNGYELIVLPLGTHPSDDASEAELLKWERTCDHCGHYSGPDEDFYTSHTVREYKGYAILLILGVCESCKWQ